MRINYDFQMTFGMVPINKIEFDIFSRHEITPVLMSLQHLYVHEKEAVKEILNFIKSDINRDDSDKLGCCGLKYWEILVLAAVRLGCDLDFDALQDLADNHRNLRQMLMVGPFDDNRYPRSTIHDNLSKLTAETIRKIDRKVVDIGHKFKPEAIEKVRGDSFVLKKNIHYPTDTNLIFDGIRKTIEMSVKIAEAHNIVGWRQHGHLLGKFKKIRRTIEKVARGRAKDKKEKLFELYKEMIKEANKLTDRALSTIHTFQSLKKASEEDISMFWNGVISNLYFFIAGTEYVCDLAKRRMINGETIPNPEKVFSLFEPDTELINRGKVPIPIEFGHRVLIMEDSAGFIVHAEVMDIGMTDDKILTDVMKRLREQYNDKIRSASFDKGFWSPANLKALSQLVSMPCLPKKGGRSQADQMRESAREFGAARKKHAGVESAIHALVAGNGLDRCRDKGPDGYRRYFALAVLGRNLHTLGRLLINQERERKGLKALEVRS
jgi:hypothetical protein